MLPWKESDITRYRDNVCEFHNPSDMIGNFVLGKEGYHMISGLVVESGYSHEVGTIFGVQILFESVSIAVVCIKGDIGVMFDIRILLQCYWKVLP